MGLGECDFSLQKCPFDAISIINLPSNLEKDTTHRYSANSFKLHRLPIPRLGVVLGLVGTNGIGKSTALKILAGKLKPNLGRYSVCLSHMYQLYHPFFLPPFSHTIPPSCPRALRIGRRFSLISEDRNCRSISLRYSRMTSRYYCSCVTASVSDRPLCRRASSHSTWIKSQKL